MEFGAGERSAGGSAATRKAARAKDLAELNGDWGTQFAVLNSNCAPDRLRRLSVDADTGHGSNLDADTMPLISLRSSSLRLLKPRGR
jgi:hypothetical protein